MLGFASGVQAFGYKGEEQVITNVSNLSGEELSKEIKDLRRELLNKKRGAITLLKNSVDGYGESLNTMANNMGKLAAATEGNTVAIKEVGKDVKVVLSNTGVINENVDSIGVQNFENTRLIIILMSIGFILVIGVTIYRKNTNTSKG